MAREAANERRCLSIYICTIHIDLATVKQSFHALEIAVQTGDMNRPRSIVYCLGAIYAVIDEQRQALCVALLAGNICWGSTFIIGLVQLGAVVDEQRQALSVALLASNPCLGKTISLPVDIYAAEKDLSRSSNFSFITCVA